jgi:hypothetical protein
MRQPLRELGIVVILIIVAAVAVRETLTILAVTRLSSFALDETPYLQLWARLGEAPRLVFAFDDDDARSRAYAAQHALAPIAVVPFRLDYVLPRISLLIEDGIPILVDCSSRSARDGFLEAIRSHSAAAGIEVVAEDLGAGGVFVKRAG